MTVKELIKQLQELGGDSTVTQCASGDLLVERGAMEHYVVEIPEAN